MKAAENSSRKFETLSDLHRVFGLLKPLHPLVSLIDIEDIKIMPNELPNSMMLNFYKIAYKKNTCAKAKYGQNYYDFGEGGLVFTAPNQIFESPHGNQTNGYLLRDALVDYFTGFTKAGKKISSQIENRVSDAN